MIPVDPTHRGLGGSDVAAILGYSPFRTAFDVWSSVTGRTPRYEFAPSQPAEWGNLIEPILASRYVATHGVRFDGIANGVQRFAHERMSWVTGRPDRVIVGVPGGRGWEGKTTSLRKADEWGDDGTSDVPDLVAVQCQHYMILTGFESWAVSVLIGGQDARDYVLKADSEVQSFLLAEAGKFWESHVLSDAPPPADSSIGARDYLGERLRKSANRVVAAPDSLRETFDRYRAAQLAKSNAEAECDVLRAQLASQVVAADAKGFSFADATFKAVEMSGRIDYKKLSEELMERAALDDATKLELSSKYMGKPAVQWRTFAKREG